MAEENRPIYWLDEPATFEVRDGISIGIFKSGGMVFEMRSSIHVLAEGLARAAAAYADFTAKQEAQIVQLSEVSPAAERRRMPRAH